MGADGGALVFDFIGDITSRQRRTCSVVTIHTYQGFLFCVFSIYFQVRVIAKSNTFFFFCIYMIYVLSAFDVFYLPMFVFLLCPPCLASV